jgi:arginyl-tRNA synthetase
MLNMTVELNALEQGLATLGLGVPMLSRDTSPIRSNPLEIWRAYLTSVLSDVVESDEETVRKCIQWPNNIFNGDLAVVLPKLRPGTKADELAVEIMEKVKISRYKKRALK